MKITKTIEKKDIDFDLRKVKSVDVDIHDDRIEINFEIDEK